MISHVGYWRLANHKNLFDAFDLGTPYSNAALEIFASYIWLTW
jgi:hypothetical protein